MTTTRTPPYRHADGSNCWTKDCSRRGSEISEKESFFNQVKEKSKSVTPVFALPPLSAFMEALKARRIDCSRHATLPYITFKYSRDTQFAYDWDEVTMASRGIIFNEETGEVLARPFAKFFNYNEPTAPTEKMTGNISVTEKLDGSLGISYEDEDGRLNIATAGSFKSPQALYATKLYQDRYEGNWTPNPKLTYMWEILYPENRVVVDYGDTNDIFLIGAVNKRTGRSIPVADVKEWKWNRAESFEMNSLNDVVSSGERLNHEGFIVHYTDTDVRVKYKHDDYLRLHRVATGVTAKTIWNKMKQQEDMNTWKKDIPEEFLEFINERQTKIQSAFDVEVQNVQNRHAQFKATLPEGYTRKEFAIALNKTPEYKKDVGYIMNIENSGKPYSSFVQANRLWDRVKPQDETTAWNM